MLRYDGNVCRALGSRAHLPEPFPQTCQLLGEHPSQASLRVTILPPGGGGAIAAWTQRSACCCMPTATRLLSVSKPGSTLPSRASTLALELQYLNTPAPQKSQSQRAPKIQPAPCQRRTYHKGTEAGGPQVVTLRRFAVVSVLLPRRQNGRRVQEAKGKQGHVAIDGLRVKKIPWNEYCGRSHHLPFHSHPAWLWRFDRCPLRSLSHVSSPGRVRLS